jgi:hypothetical protein
MKISLSRKGVDSGTNSGRMASPILPCGCLCSIPIPTSNPGVRYSDIRFGKRTILELRRGLTSDNSDGNAHLDPDLRRESLNLRHKNWRAAFGQSGAAAGLLVNQGFTRGDLFIFFGWFRKTVVSGEGILKFDPKDSHGRHIVYGWLEVDEIVDKPSPSEDLSFLNDHPHIRWFSKEAKPNIVYVSAQTKLRAGVFSNESEGVVLTQPGGRRSMWSLPAEFESLYLKRGLTYHPNPKRWVRDGERFSLKAVSRGQEFVFDGNLHPSAADYFVKRIKSATSSKSRQCPHAF